MSANEWIGLIVVCILTAIGLALDIRRAFRRPGAPESSELEIQRLRQTAIREFYEREEAISRAHPTDPSPRSRSR